MLMMMWYSDNLLLIVSYLMDQLYVQIFLNYIIDNYL